MAWTLLAILAVPLAYGAAGYVSGFIPVNDNWREAKQGVTIYVETNGVHTSLILPIAAEGIDWRGLVSPNDLADPRYAGDHYGFGWGERRFYLNTPTWADLDARTVIRATIGSDETLVHVDHVVRPFPDRWRRPLRLSSDEYRRLSAYIRASFAPGRPKPIPGYTPSDIFYEGRGHYDAITTCNEWTGAALRATGVRVGAWTPFESGVMRWFR
ncbi:TIGR02117 family protein [Sphingomonas cavernae]|uniref:TIGR02117 family protein n=1 Tax=Sphingomonas cavernae TaxID=2320861 RepID=A0A418WNC3_9SPHN|nr:TIGR02117 family protein [Sphingomonas cavernae]